jgi:hypothetical protein
VKSEDTSGLGKVVHKGYDGIFKVSEDDLAMGNDDANTSQGSCVSVYIVLLKIEASPVQILQNLLSCSYYSYYYQQFNSASFPKERKNRMWGQGNGIWEIRQQSKIGESCPKRR